MKYIREASEDEMIYEFLKGELEPMTSPAGMRITINF
jgi:hypothetical protein